MSNHSDETDILLLIPPDFFSPAATNNFILDKFFETHRQSKSMSDYPFLSPLKQIELNQLNGCLSAIENDFIPSSAISNTDCSSPNLVHSTPKDKLSSDILLENENNDEVKKNDKNASIQRFNGNFGEEDQQIFSAKAGNLISLSEIWGRNEPSNDAAIEEAHFRRIHLEKTVRLLQGQLLEYQQKISFAIEVDHRKDIALSSLQKENKSLSEELHRLRDVTAKLENDQFSYNQRYDTMQKELSHALELASKFQEKNDKMEGELCKISRKANESSDYYRKQIDELESKANCLKKSEELSILEANKLKDKLVKAEYNAVKAISRCEQLEKELETLKHQKESLQDFYQKQKARADALEAQKKSLRDSIANLTEKESALSRKLETQRQALKSHYQQQLEHVVSQKLQEFQQQLDKVEENLRSEAKNRERLIADRAIKQMELINEKNEVEINLLQQKHNQEIELYRIQLANASEKIDSLEEKLNVYKTKRADIAEKLHEIMEVHYQQQWQKALEVLTSPSQYCRDNHNPANSQSNGRDIHCSQPEDRIERNRKSTAENEMFETPTSSRSKSKSTSRDSHIHDRLRAYIDLLLSKSPTDFDKLDEILAAQSKQKSSEKLEKPGKRSTTKPPWKA